MGKSEEAPKDNSDEETSANEETKDEKVETEKDEIESPKPSEEPAQKEETKDEGSEEEKSEKDDLRKVIKVDSKEGGEKEPIKDDPEATPRESLEQKRAILQSIKDFDFLIQKNQEDISQINNKLDSITKDLDDLVSLYEIVSEQMNPFVGLSKVTKKRIDALENFTKEIEDLKERTGELESFAEQSGAKIKNLSERQREKVKTIDTDTLLNDITSDEEIGIINDEIDEETPQPISTFSVENNIWEDLSDEDLDKIIERTLGGSPPEEKIDMIIDKFIESLKG
jgi:flagellar protein FlaC